MVLDVKKLKEPTAGSIFDHKYLASLSAYSKLQEFVSVSKEFKKIKSPSWILNYFVM